ncbi:MAG: ATP-binding protein [Bacteroidetes bacterium]|nr:ATP-binding protein [Bacteroidota bacterium]
MIKNKDTLIGKVASVTGNQVSVKMLESTKSLMPIIDGILYRVGQLGSFLKIPLGYANLYGIVTQIGVDALPESLKQLTMEDYEKAYSTRWLSMVLIGEKTINKFERGVTQFPTAEDEVHIVTIEDLDLIYGSLDEITSITVGNISVSESLPAKIDLNKLVTRHCAILGSTGSGKSNTVAVLLESIAKNNFNSARILVIDPHGEYNETLKEFSKVYKINAEISDNQLELFIPYWALPFNELMKIFPGSLNDKQLEYVRRKVLDKKTSYIETNKLEKKIKIESLTADSPIPFSINHLWFELDDFERQTFREMRKPETITDKKEGDASKLISNEYEPASAGGGSPFLNHQAQSILSFLDGMRNRLLDQRYNFLFKPGNLTPDLAGIIKKDLSGLLSEWLGDNRPITILDLSGIPSEIMTPISGSILKIMYDSLFWGQNLNVGGRKQPLLIVLEEAHNYLKSGENSISSRTVQTISKEGRKYGVGLLLVTQRPTELDETVLSQCGTTIALRMNNRGDRGHVSAAVQDELSNMTDLLPSLRTGEGLILGEAVKIPSRVKFRKIANAPKSSDPDVTEQWRKQKPDNSEYEKVVENWRNQKFK